MNNTNHSFADISWQVSEPEYRQDSALSYSTIAKYAREGFQHLDTLFDRVESPSLTFGSCVDTLLTEGEKAFSDRFFIGDIPTMKPSVEPVVKEIYNQYHDAYTDINSIPDSSLAPIISQFGYQPNWKPETRCKVIRQEGAAYYQTMFMANGKEIVSQDIYNKVFACVTTLKDSPATKMYFCEDNPFDDIEHLYQLKFKGIIDDVPFRCMADLIIVDYKNKKVIPCDLKTSSHREYMFPESFIQWRYDIQSRLYWRLIRQTMDKDDFFKDFQLLDYRFIVVNNIDNPVPLVWRFDKTQALGEITLGNKVLSDPVTIGKELYGYLQEQPVVPNGIFIDRPNSIDNWFN